LINYGIENLTAICKVQIREQKHIDKHTRQTMAGEPCNKTTRKPFFSYIRISVYI